MTLKFPQRIVNVTHSTQKYHSSAKVFVKGAAKMFSTTDKKIATAVVFLCLLWTLKIDNRKIGRGQCQTCTIRTSRCKNKKDKVTGAGDNHI